MIYPQFQQSPMQNRLSHPRTWLALAIGVGFICLSLVLLPFILLFGAIASLSLVLFSRFYLARKLARHQQAQRQQSQQHSTQSEFYHQNAQTTEPTLVRESPNEHHQGRTFEHRADE